MLQSVFGFTHPDTVGPDPEDPAQLRAKTHPLTSVPDPAHHQLHAVEITDLSAPQARVPTLEREGFAHVDLEGHGRLCEALRRVRSAGQLVAEDEQRIRRALVGRSLRTGDGRRLRVLHIAREGFIMRRQGPDGRPPPALASRTGSTDELEGMATREGARPGPHHDAARIVHIDQDVNGTPLRQILRGAAPWVFRHRAPRSVNRRAPLSLLNLWIPLDQVVAPLALLDGATLDRARHQLRYGLPTEDLLEGRAADRRVNDIWTLLHHPDQRWYFTSQLELGRAYLFETLSTAHAAFTLPGEDRAAAVLDQLELVERSWLPREDPGEGPGFAATRAAIEAATSAPRTVPLEQAVETGFALLEEALSDPGTADAPQATVGDRGQPWSGRLASLRQRLTRKSLEMRLVATSG